jgi:hypothetical protein
MQFKALFATALPFQSTLSTSSAPALVAPPLSALSASSTSPPKSGSIRALSRAAHLRRCKSLPTISTSLQQSLLRKSTPTRSASALRPTDSFAKILNHLESPKAPSPSAVTSATKIQCPPKLPYMAAFMSSAPLGSSLLRAPPPIAGYPHPLINHCGVLQNLASTLLAAFDKIKASINTTIKRTTFAPSCRSTTPVCRFRCAPS